jgi:arginyl-tRNA synthetase
MLFDPKESLSFTGNTGPYLQYMGARISSMLRKADKGAGDAQGGEAKADFSLLVSDPEWELVKAAAGYPHAAAEAASGLDPSRLTGYLYWLSKCFSRFYHECPILNSGNPALSKARLELSRAVMLILKDAFYLANIPFLSVM